MMKGEQRLSGYVEIFSPQLNLWMLENALPETANRLTDGLHYKEWQLLMQERHRYKTICVLAARCASCLAEKRWTLGIKLARYWLEIDPMNEDALCCLMTMLVGDGQPEEALRQYEWYQWRLSAELAIEPSLSTQKLAHQIASEHDLSLSS